MTTVTLEKITKVNQIMVDEHGNVHVRIATRFMDGTKVLSEEYHRHVVMPGDELGGEDDSVKKIAKAAWTPELIKAAEARRKSAPD